MRRKIIIIVIAALLLGVFVFWKFGPSFSKKQEQKGPANLTIYGLWENEEFIKPAIDAYIAKHPGVTIKYVYQSSQNYRTRVQTQIDNNQGPDIFMISNSWLPMFLTAGEVYPMPESVMSFKDFQQAFYPSVKNDFSVDGKVYAISRGVDGLALFYNEELLNNANVEVPQTWDQFQNAAIKLTVKGENEKIQTAGAAIGTTGNVDHWSEILGLLFLQQPGANPEQPNSQAGKEVVKFFTDFTLDPKKRVWDPSFEPSTQAFAAGKLAFYFGPSWRAFEIRQANPDLKFKIASVPQLPGRTVAWGSYWGYAVSSKSKFKDEAWDFIKFLTSVEEQKRLYQTAASVRLFGLPYSRVELQKDLISDPIVGPFVYQAPYYKSWYLQSNTFDQGINDQIIKYYEDALNAIAAGNNDQLSLDTATKGIAEVINKFTKPLQPQASPQ